VGLDPLAAGASANAAIAAIVDAELAVLAADAAALKALLSDGAVVQARVLPSNGLTDLIQIGNFRVAASLPPDLLPGDVITVRVTGFDGERINVQILPAGTPAAVSSPGLTPTAPTVSAALAATALTIGAPGDLPGPVAPPSAGAPTPAGPVTGMAPTVVAGQAVASPTPPQSAPAPVPTTPPLAPPSAVFAAAAVRPAGPNPGLSQTSAVPRPGTPSADVAAFARPASSEAVLGSIEARLAAARTALTPLRSNAAAPANPATSAPANTNAPPARPFIAPPYINRPAIEQRAAPIPNAVTSATAAATAVATAAGAARTAPTVQTNLARGLELYREPVALLRALRLPVTPTNVASARIAIETPEKLPVALSILERALPNSTDPRVTTLRTIAAFLARIEPDSPVLATQIAAYVEHVLTGNESKLAQLFLAARGAVPTQDLPEGARAPGVPQAPSAPNSPAGLQTGPPANARDAASAAPNVAPLPDVARVVERQAALQFDLKTQLLSIATNPPPNAAPALSSAVASALTAITALQVNAAATLAANPTGFAFAIPIALPNGFAQANVRIDREAPNTARTPLDGDNFHIAFVLETSHLGTVAIDLVTVGRTVTVGVKTEATLAARAFGKAIGGLRDRLEKLRYTVAKADASVAAHGTLGVVETTLSTAVPAPPVDPTKLVDRSA